MRAHPLDIPASPSIAQTFESAAAAEANGSSWLSDSALAMPDGQRHLR